MDHKAEPNGCKFPYTQADSYTQYVRREVVPLVARTYGRFGEKKSTSVPFYTGPENKERLAGVRRLYEAMPSDFCSMMHIVGQPPDGTCLFHALGFIIGIGGDLMRRRICDWYADPRNAGKISTLNRSRSNPTDQINPKYIHEMRARKFTDRYGNITPIRKHGTDNEISAFCYMSGLNVCLFNKLTRSVGIGGLRDPGAYKDTIILCYSGSHYDSLIPYNESAYTQFLQKYYYKGSPPSIPAAPSPAHSSRVVSHADMGARMDKYDKDREKEKKFFADLHASNKRKLDQSNVADKATFTELFNHRLVEDLESVDTRHEQFIAALFQSDEKAQSGGANIFYKSRSYVPESYDRIME